MPDANAKPTPRSRRLAIVLTALAALLGFVLGDGYIGRLPQHAGYYLVPVHDEVRAPLSSRPRRTVFLLVDGLRRDAAETMAVTRALEGQGQCRVSDQGTWTVSRPVYALLSTGLEVDRTGARNNEQTAPLAAQSIWEVARGSGLRVSGSSHLPWFRQLFPEGFDRYHTGTTHQEDVFANGGAELLDVNLFHPLYVDEAGHQHGAASPEYAAGVARADREIAPLLAQVDLAQDLVIFTADHGHRAQGGHGGAQPEIKDVLLCFAGKNVARRSDRARFDGRTVAPTLAVLLGIPFPRDLRAGDDALGSIWEVATFGDADRRYVDDRHAAIERFREENRAALERWLGDAPGTWPRLYARAAQAQDIRALLVGLAAVAFLVVRVRGGRARGERPAATLLWLASSAVLLWAAHRIVLGAFDFTVINLSARFVPRAFGIVALAAAVGIGAHALVVRRLAHLASDLLTMVGLLVFANAGHVLVYGWPLGFPLPGAAARYFPFFGAIALVGYALLALAVLLVAAKRAGSADRAPLRE